MKDYVKDFDEKLQDESFSDDTLLSIARDYIRELQDMIEVPTTAIINDLNIHSRLFVFDGCHKIYLVDDDDVEDVKKNWGDDTQFYPIERLPYVFWNTCSLRFISCWKGDRVVPQCESVVKIRIENKQYELDFRKDHFRMTTVQE